MSPKAEDPRVIRTKSLIAAALIERMREQPYDKIRVQDITKTAEIARQTFYLHYQTKDDVLIDYVDGVFEEFYQDIEGHIVASPEPDPIITWYLFKQWQDHGEVTKTLIEADIEHLVLRSFKNYITRVLGLYIRNHQVRIKDSESLAYCVDYLAGATWMVLQRWIKNDYQYPVEKIAQLYSELSRPGILKVLSQGGAI